MKLKTKKNKKISKIYDGFGLHDFGTGEIFKYDGVVYMKIMYVDKFPYNAVCLDDGRLIEIADDANLCHITQTTIVQN